MNITMVKKIKADGNLCRKSADVFEKLKKLSLIDRIDNIVFADERKPSSEGLDLAMKHAVEAAPFFIVEKKDGSRQVYTKYCRFLNEVFGQKTSESEEIAEIMAQNPELDLI